MLVEVTTPVGALGLGRDRRFPEGTAVEFERTASVGGSDGPTLVVTGPDAWAVADGFREGRSVDDVTVVLQAPDRVVCRVTWRDAPPDLVADVRAVGGSVLSAAATDDTWSLALRFPVRDAASAFYTGYDDADHPVTIQRIHPDAATRRSAVDGLTADQRVALRHALEAGYFEVPRRTSLVEIGRELDISDVAVSQRLRRGLATLLSEVADPPRPIASGEDASD